MPTYKLTLAYDGSSFRGWQRLGQGERTVQACLEAALGRVLGRETPVVGSSRTDAGVHAQGQVASFRLEGGPSANDLLHALSPLLPDDLSCLSVEEESERFHARLNATGKLYRYRVARFEPRSEPRDPFQARYCHRAPGPLDAGAMRDYASALLGEHHFGSFTSLKEGKKSLVKTVKDIDVLENGVYIDILFRAPSFLYNQARMMAGALLLAGSRGLSSRDAERLLGARSRRDAPPVAEAKGLCLLRVDYE
jgi:tRNA pseudouridine38-40 synthase